jgi:AraC-like DNA-binding protein
MAFSITEILLLVVVLQFFTLSIFLLLLKSDRNISHILLGLYFLVLSLNLFDQFLFIHKVYFDFPNLALWSGAFPFLFGPLLFLYVQSVISRRPSRINILLHLLPFLVVFLASEAIYLSQNRSDQLVLLKLVYERDVPRYFHVVSIFVLVHFFCYVSFALRNIRAHKAKVIHQCSDYQKQNLSWLSNTILFFALIMLMSTINALLAVTDFADLFFGIFGLILIMLFLYTTQTVFSALQRTDFYSEIQINTGRPSSLRLPEAEVVRIVEELNHSMKIDKLYRNPELTLNELADRLGVRSNVVTQVLNENLKQNFFDFINRFRIEEAKLLLRQAPDTKILAILMDSGFNSKSSFNSLFKKYTGYTPSQFRKSPK